jgi:hypothetical protein
MSALTFLNATPYIAQFMVYKGDLVIARLPGITPNATLELPDGNDVYEVVANTIIEGNTYTTAPVYVSGATAFLAEVKQNLPQGTYDFDMKVEDSSAADRMEFQKTTIGPVTFVLSKNNVHLQNVVVTDSFMVKTLAIDSTYSICAVINGVTTDTVQTSNPNAVVKAEVDESDLEAGYFTLSVA